MGEVLVSLWFGVMRQFVCRIGNAHKIDGRRRGA